MRSQFPISFVLVLTESVVHNGAKIFLKSYSNFLLEFVSSTNYHGPINEKIQKCDKGKTLYSCETRLLFVNQIMILFSIILRLFLGQKQQQINTQTYLN